MSKDLDKLAAEMRKMKPSKGPRARAMEAAMSAFSDEFLPETAAAKIKAAELNQATEKKIDSSQGFTAEPRPTGQKARGRRVQTFGRDAMSKFNNLINFKPQTMMMAGTCAAALIAGMIVLPNMGELGIKDAEVKTVSVEAVADMDAAVAKRAEVSVPAVTTPAPVAEPQGEKVQPDQSTAEVVDTAPAAPKVQSGISSVDALLDSIRQNADKTDADNEAREMDFQNSLKNMSKAEQENVLRERENAVREYSAILQQKNNIELFVGQQDIFTESARTEVKSLEATGVEGQQLDDAKLKLERLETWELQKQKELAKLNALQAKSDTLLNKNPQNSALATPPPPQIERMSASTSLRRVRSQDLTLQVQTDRTSTVISSEANSTPSTLPQKIAGLTVDVVETKSVVPNTINTINTSKRGQFTVFNGVSNQVVQSTETIVSDTGEILCRVLIPAKYKTITKQVIVSPARTRERIIPAVTKDITVKLANDDGSFREVIKKIVIREEQVDFEIIPAKYETKTERVLVEPAREEWKPDSQAINSQAFKPKVVTTSKIYLRDDDGNVVREFASRDAFEHYKANLPTPVEEKPVSTFSVDVDTASYSFLRASVNRGQLPPRSSIRLEEMINYFPYDYDAPKSADEPFKANVTVTSNPWNADTKLMHIGIKGYVPKETEKPRNNLVFLIDTSGSMNRANKLPLLINSFKLLLNTLDEDDTVSIVVYASASGTVLEPTSVRNNDDILAALNKLRAGGSTAGAAGLQLAYEKAEENFDDESNNRIILATDGDFNVGFSSPADMKTFISKKRDTGISLSVLGFGMGNYNDHLMQSLAQNGNGVAAYIDSLAEAQKVLANEAGSNLMTIAKDVKIQVEFNPAKIAEYRLIGYETRALKRQDFNNDKVDAGEIGAGHSVTAIYEMTPVDSPARAVDKLRYVADKLNLRSKGSNEFAFVKIRHKLPNADTSTLQTFPITARQEKSLNRASDDMRFATAVAIAGQKLRGDVQVEDYSYEDVIKLATKAKGKDENGYRAEFIQMVRLIDGLGE